MELYHNAQTARKFLHLIEESKAGSRRSFAIGLFEPTLPVAAITYGATRKAVNELQKMQFESSSKYAARAAKHAHPEKKASGKLYMSTTQQLVVSRHALGPKKIGDLLKHYFRLFGITVPWTDTVDGDFDSNEEDDDASPEGTDGDAAPVIQPASNDQPAAEGFGQEAADRPEADPPKTLADDQIATAQLAKRKRVWAPGVNAWRQARKSVDKQTDDLSKFLSEQKDDPALVQIAGMVKPAVTRIVAPIDELVMRLDAGDRMVMSAVRETIGEFRTNLNEDEQIAVCDENPWGRPIMIVATLEKALERLESCYSRRE